MARCSATEGHQNCSAPGTYTGDRTVWSDYETEETQETLKKSNENVTFDHDVDAENFTT